MKKHITLVLILALCLTGCSVCKPLPTEPSATAATAPSTAPTPPPTAIPTTAPTVPETTVDITSLPQLSTANITLTTAIERAENGVLFEYSYPNVALNLPNSAVTDDVMLELLNRIDGTRVTAEDILSTADSTVSSFYDVRYNPMRIDPNVLSLFGAQTSYAGGAHPYSESVSVTYDLTNGNVLLLGDILNPGCTAADLTPLVINVLENLSEEYYLYSDYTATVEERFGQGLDSEQGWYLSAEGLCIYFSPYEIAPYSTGEVIATIPYDQLNGLLRDQFFPVEKSGGIGVINGELFRESDISRFEQLYDVTIDDEGEIVLLSTTGLVYDLILEYGTWNAEGTQFIPTSTVFAASSLSYNEAVTVQLFIPDVMSNLRLTYTTDEGTTQKFIFQSGKDGSILLLDN
jgi:hypothetical protein